MATELHWIIDYIIIANIPTVILDKFRFAFFWSTLDEVLGRIIFTNRVEIKAARSPSLSNENGSNQFFQPDIINVDWFVSGYCWHSPSATCPSIGL